MMNNAASSVLRRAFRILLPVALSVSFFVFHAEGVGPAAGQDGYPQVAAPPPDAQETLRVLEGKSFVLNTSEIIRRVAITNDQVAAAVVVTPYQVLVHGIKPGTVSFLIWNEDEQVRAFDLQVMEVPMNLEPLRAVLNKALPAENIRVSQSGSSIVLTGNVSSAETVEQAAALAKTAAGDVVNLLSSPPMTRVVMLEVKFAEVSRNAIRELGMNILSTGALNTPGTISTRQFPSPGNLDLQSSIGASLSGFATEYNLTDLLNIFVFRPDLNLGLLIRALQQKNLMQTLAEPNLIALGGKEASFLAGGEFPVPVVSGGANPTVSVQFKEFGVRLQFVANPMPDGTIHLRVAPEVSALDYANAVTLSGFQIPALITRKAETEVQLRDGQSFAVAGLLDNRITRIDSKVPWLGDVPILGNLFRSTRFAAAESELLVMVTPRLVTPVEAGQDPPLPELPLPFLDREQFDGGDAGAR
ncbi:MAG TPA: pilus assembly protein N-terminal domain-containing protein [Acidobacteriota bacterium]|nr:pilus assembly protein N-terminal domain-containing protein [Acidobacteriota bacterium]